MEYCSVTKIAEILSFGMIGMDLVVIMLSEINQNMKDRYQIVLPICEM